MLPLRIGRAPRFEQANAFAQAEVAVHGRPVRFQVAGHGEPVVLLHGLAGSARWWRRNVAALAEHHTVYLLNLPGFGSFRWRSLRLALHDAEVWLAAWIEAVGIAPCHLVAHSMGGYLGVRLAAHQPALLQRLVLVAPAGVPSGRRARAYAGPLFQAVLRVSPTFLPLLALDSLRAGPVTILLAARDLLARDVRADLHAIAAPTLLVWGDRDALVPPSIGPLMRAEIPNARLLILSGAGHVPQYDQPRQFNAGLLAFLAGQVVGE